jgi:DNA polymerase elongation subunit (family B)
MYVGGDKDGYKMDGGILGVFVAITKIIEESRVQNGADVKYRMEFDRVTQTNLTTWWAQILRHYRAPEADAEYKVKADYEGGAILEPVAGLYKELEVVDVQSLYPSIIINYNISHETINCEHGLECNPIQVPGLPLTICGQRKGIFSQICKKYKTLRVEYKEKGDKAMATGLKIFLNGGYGAYGNEYFRYADMRVASAVTAFGRWITTQQLKPEAEKLGFQVPYGDTDSLFLNWKGGEGKQEAVKALVAWAESEMDIVLEHEKTFKWVILVGKKHYVGRMYNKKENRILIKGMEGKKGDRCKWVRETFDAVIKAIDENTNPVEPFTKAVEELMNNRVSHDNLKIWTKLSKDPQDYGSNCTSKQVGNLHKATIGDMVWYFKAKKGATLEYAGLDKEKYIDQLRTAVEDCLRHCGYDVSKKKKGKDTSLEGWTTKKASEDKPIDTTVYKSAPLPPEN